MLRCRSSERRTGAGTGRVQRGSAKRRGAAQDERVPGKRPRGVGVDGKERGGTERLTMNLKMLLNKPSVPSKYTKERGADKDEQK